MNLEYTLVEVDFYMKKIFSFLIIFIISLSICSCSISDLSANDNDLIVGKINKIMDEPNLGYDLCYRGKGASSYSSNYYLISFERDNITSIGVAYSKKDSKDIKSIVILTCAPITGSLENGWIIEGKASYKYFFSDDNKKVFEYKNNEMSKEYAVIDVSYGIKYLKKALSYNYTNDVKYQTLTGHYFEDNEEE